MRIQSHSGEEEDQINLLPLIDMVFLLLIFFLVATTIASEERDLKVQLPTTSVAQPLSAPPQQLVINVLEDGTIRVSGETYSVPKLAELLKRVAKDDASRDVLVRADGRSLHKHYAEIVSLCHEAGIQVQNIGYLRGDPQP